MSRPVVFSLLAMLCYGFTNVIFEQKFSKFNNLTLMSVYMVPILLVAIIGRYLVKTSDPAFDFPHGKDLSLLIFVGFVLAAADYFYVGAYTNGGDLLTVTCIVLMFPAFASIFRFFWVQSWPNLWHISGYILAVFAVLLIAKGSSQ